MIKRIKLAKALLKFVDVVANDGTVITTEGELEVGKEAYTTDETGDVIPLPTGEYEVNGILIVVESGIIKEMKETTVVEEPATTEEPATEQMEESTEEANTDDTANENTTDEVEDLKKEIEALKAENEALKAEIETLKAEIEKAKEPVAEIVEDKFKATEKTEDTKEGKIDFSKYIKRKNK